MALHPEVDDEHFKLLESFNIISYDKANDLQHIDEAWKELFHQKGEDNGSKRLPPPIQDALLQHVKRGVAYQAGIWCTSELTEQHAPSPEGWGWTLHKDSQSGTGMECATCCFQSLQ